MHSSTSLCCAVATSLAVLLTHCVHLILRKISKFDATRCSILRLKRTKCDFRWCSASYPAEVLTVLPRVDPLDVFKGGEGEGKRRGSEGRGRATPKYFGLEPFLVRRLLRDVGEGEIAADLRPRIVQSVDRRWRRVTALNPGVHGQSTRLVLDADADAITSRAPRSRSPPRY